MTPKSTLPHPKNCCALVMMVIGSLLALPLSGATFLVGDEAELAAAIVESNTNSASDIIELTGSIVLTSALPVIASDDAGLTILGGGFTLSRDSEAETEFGIIRIDSANVEIENLTISGGIDEEGGGGVFVDSGVLTMVGCTVTGNAAGEKGGGGGIFVENGDLTLTRCSISDNSAAGGGGVFAVASSGSEVTGETTVTLIDCTIAGNTVYEAEDGLPLGGGILILGGVEMLVTGCTISDNSALLGAGFAAAMGGNATFMNTTVSGNTAMMGGGILNFWESTVTLINCTVTGNSSDMFGGGIANAAGGSLTILASVIAGNEANQGSEVSGNEEEPGILADGSNVLGHSGLTQVEAFMNFTPGSSDRVCTSDGDTPTALGSILNPTLADNGGPTLTHALVAGSPAINLVSKGPETDQRGISRPQGSGYDAGAFEFEGGSDPDPEPIALYEAYWHTGTVNTINPNSWNLDPSGILGDDPEHTLASGALPKGLSLAGKSLVGTFLSLGNYAFTVVSRSGIDEVRNHFYIQVIPPTLTPLIVGLWVNGNYYPTVILKDRTHGDAAVTELFNVTVPVGSPLELKLNWDYIKDESSFRIIRGQLPQGLALRQQVEDGKPVGVIEGTPIQTGESIFVVSVLDWRGRGYQWIRLVVE